MMVGTLDIVQDELRDPHYSPNMGRGEFALRKRFLYKVHQFQTDERNSKDWEWLASLEGQKELSKKKYRNKFTYVTNQSIAGYGDTALIAAEMARKKTGIDPCEMIRWYQGDLEF